MLRVGLTGGIGAGKSEVARRLAEHGAIVIDADQLARDVVAAGTDGLAEVVEAFGPGVLGADGGLDRAALAATVFGDDPARRRLEGIIHPRVRARTTELFTQAPVEAVVINDVPLLVEVGLAATYHLVIVVEAAERTRLDRLIRGRGMSESEARSRLRAQASDEARREAADVLIANDGTLADLHAEVDALWTDRLVPFERNLRLRHRVPYPDPLRLVAPEPDWPIQYQRVAARIERVFDGRIDHIGSTAVPGLLAKDVLDIQLTVPDLQTADRLAEPLARAGFPAAPGRWWDRPKPGVGGPEPAEPDPVPAESGSPAPGAEPGPPESEKRLHGSADPGRIVHLHLRVEGSPGWRYSLLIRDWLRAHPAARDEYAARKRELADQGLTTGEYAEAKEPWFDAFAEPAQRWADATGWQP